MAWKLNNRRIAFNLIILTSNNFSYWGMTSLATKIMQYLIRTCKMQVFWIKFQLNIEELHMYQMSNNAICCLKVSGCFGVFFLGPLWFWSKFSCVSFPVRSFCHSRSNRKYILLGTVSISLLSQDCLTKDFVFVFTSS